MKGNKSFGRIALIGISFTLAVFMAGSCFAKDLLPMKVSYLPIMDLQQLYVAWDKGFFEQEGLKVEGQAAQGGAVSQTLVESGSVDLGFTAVVPLSLAHVKGFDFVFVAPAAYFDSTNLKADGMVVKKDSPFKSFKDLAGKKIAVNGLNNVDHLAVLAYAGVYGVDPKTLQFVEVPFPSMAAALREGAVDAAHLGEPFITASETEGTTRLLHAGFYPPEVVPRAMVGGWFAKRSSLSKNKEKLTRFLKAINKATDFINKNPGEMPAIVAKYTKLTPELVSKLTSPRFYTTVYKKDFQVQIDLCAKYGFIKKGFDASEIVATDLISLK